MKVTQSWLTLCNPMNHGLHSPWNSSGQNTGVGRLSLLQGIFPTQGSKPVSLLQVDYLPAEPQGKPKNTGVGSLSLLQRIFLTQESNWGLLHCRQILYQLSYQATPTSSQSCCELTTTGEKKLSIKINIRLRKILEMQTMIFPCSCSYN